MSDWKKELEDLANWSKANWWKTGNCKRSNGTSVTVNLGHRNAKKNAKKVEKNVDNSRNL